MKNLLIKIKIYLGGSLAALILVVVYRTMRWSTLNLGNIQGSVFDGPPKMLLFWHGRQLMIPANYWACRSPNRILNYALISMHSDGRLIAFAIRLLGARSIAGSSSRGGKEASIAIIKALRGGFNVSITPDGPTGPIYQAKPGALKIAYKTGVSIVPVSFSASSYWQFGSWDKMILPKPFSRGVFVVGEPFRVNEDLSDANIKGMLNDLNQRLTDTQERADRYFDA